MENNPLSPSILLNKKIVLTREPVSESAALCAPGHARQGDFKALEDRLNVLRQSVKPCPRCQSPATIVLTIINTLEHREDAERGYKFSAICLNPTVTDFCQLKCGHKMKTNMFALRENGLPEGGGRQMCRQLAQNWNEDSEKSQQQTTK